jgi:hypothetical protein
MCGFGTTRQRIEERRGEEEEEEENILRCDEECE